ncbi:MAG: tetratricopeptide repeat protein [Actinomycetota bacterium]|nr:tetratricopeptide repeat protein [Actinomycetota bacterium]
MDTLQAGPTPRKTGGTQRDVKTIRRLNRLARLLILLLLLLAMVMVFRFVTGQFTKPRTYYEYQLQSWNQILAKKPDDPMARTRIGQIYLKMGQTSRAISQFDAVLKDNPKYVPGLYYLAVAYEKQGLLKEAEAKLIKAIDLTPNDQVKVLPAFRLGSIYKKQGRTDRAIKYFEMAVRGEPVLWNPHFELGELYNKKGELNKALTQYEEAARFNPTKKLKSKIAAVKAELGI